MAEEIVQPTTAETDAAKGKGKTKKSSKRKKGAKAANGATRRGTPLGFPKHPILKCLRIPQAVLENNAGKECTDREATKFAGIGWSAQIAVEISSAIKYGFTRRIVRPQKPTDKVDDRRVTNAMASWTAWFTTLIQPLASLIQTGYAELPLATRRLVSPLLLRVPISQLSLSSPGLCRSQPIAVRERMGCGKITYTGHEHSYTHYRQNGWDGMELQSRGIRLAWPRPPLV